MLENLNKINWDNIQAQFFTGEEIPRLILKLNSPEAVVDGKIWADLWNMVYHQGTISEVAIYIVPFLLELLQNEEVKNNKKHEILDLLKELAFNMGYNKQGKIELSPDWVPEHKFYEIIDKPEIIQTHKIVGTGIDLYIQFLEHPDRDIRKMAALLLDTVLFVK